MIVHLPDCEPRHVEYTKIMLEMLNMVPSMWKLPYANLHNYELAYVILCYVKCNFHDWHNVNFFMMLNPFQPLFLHKSGATNFPKCADILTFVMKLWLTWALVWPSRGRH